MSGRLVVAHFEWADVVCRCCGRVIVDERFWRHMELLEALRTRLGWPMLMDSGHRCERHNREVGGEPQSQHLHFATDVRPGWEEEDSAESWEAKLGTLWQEAEAHFDGVGRYDTFVHMDLRGARAAWDLRKHAAGSH